MTMKTWVSSFCVSRLLHGGQLLNGLAGPTIMSAGPLLSTTWFAPDQRATATAVASLISYLGAATSFVVGPLFVPAPNDTLVVNKAAVISDVSIRDRIQLVMYAGTGGSTGTARPSSGPGEEIDNASFSASCHSLSRHSRVKGMKALRSNTTECER